MGYSGLVPSEHSSGNRVQRGGITKTGNGHLRRVIGEAAWAYQHRPNVIGFLAQRQKNLAISEESKKIAWKAQQRLHKRYNALSARGKKQEPDRDCCRTRTAGLHLGHRGRRRKATQARLRGINRIRVFYWTAEPMAAQGPRKGEPSSRSMRYRLRPQPAHLVRGSSRRIMTMRFRPANIRVINRRVCSWTVIGPAVPKTKGERNLRFLSPLESPFFPQAGSELTSGNVFPLRRPSTIWWKPERCSPSRIRFAAPKAGASLTAPRRSGQTDIATGGSGGNTSRIAAPRQKRRLPAGAGLIQSKSVRLSQGLTGSLHIRTRIDVPRGLVAAGGRRRSVTPFCRRRSVAPPLARHNSSSCTSFHCRSGIGRYEVFSQYNLNRIAYSSEADH